MTAGIRVLIVDPDPGFFTELSHALSGEGCTVRHAGDLASARRALEESAPDAVLVEERLPDGRGAELLRELRGREDAPALLAVALAPTTSSVAELVREGALDVLEKPVFGDRAVGAVLRAVDSRRAPRRAARPASDLSRPPIIGESDAVARLRDQITRVTDTPQTTVLIQGESGTGKELVARAIHFDGHRGARPFMAINCAALNENILEAELFGYERGAFTGANVTGKQGLFEAADGGSVFLDEVGEMAPSLQAKLLRFLEEKTFKRVGGLSDIRVDVRVIAATNRVLADSVASGVFREDLYYRLNVIRISLPPLRDRPEDVPLLAEHFLQQFTAKRRGRPLTLPPSVLSALCQYRWPGNIRELKNVIERLVARGIEGEVRLDDLPPEIQGDATPPTVVAASPAAASSLAQALYARVVERREDFWECVHATFMARDMTRADLRAMVERGLTTTGGNYRLLVELFGMPPSDYKRFLSFLRKYDCHVPFQQFRTPVATRGTADVPARPPAFRASA
jgi:DNA-binding NtrC family response regulator